MSKIFLSYRRSDEPGYVGRLADGLTDLFGSVVFRDVDSIRGGDKWKLAVQRHVSQAQVVIAVIGKRWGLILAELDPETDYVRIELNLAHMLEIPVIPVQMQDASFDPQLDLGDLSWLRDLQIFEISDRQGRWASDVDKLVVHIEELTNLERISKPDKAKDVGPADPVSQKTTHGSQSPIIESESGDVTISYSGDDKD